MAPVFSCAPPAAASSRTRLRARRKWRMIPQRAWSHGPRLAAHPPRFIANNLFCFCMSRFLLESPALNHAGCLGRGWFQTRPYAPSRPAGFRRARLPAWLPAGLPPNCSSVFPVGHARHEKRRHKQAKARCPGLSKSAKIAKIANQGRSAVSAQPLPFQWVMLPFACAEAGRRLCWCGERGVVWAEPRRLTARPPVQIANGADLPPMHGQMQRLVEA